MKRLLSLTLVLGILLSTASALAAPFTDSTGRTLEVVEPVERIAVTGQLAQITLFALAPDAMVGLAAEWSKAAEEFVGDYYGLALLGQLYGGKGGINLEEIAAADPQVIIDVGEPKDTIQEDMDDLQAQVGIPVAHVTMTMQTSGDAYRALGKLLGREVRAEALAAYCEDTYAKIQSVLEKVGENKVRVMYCLGDQGLNAIAKGSYHGEIIDMLGDNVAVVESPSSRGTGNEVDMEQIMLWNPDFIIFQNDSVYQTVANDKVWQSLPAISDGNYVEVPFGPYNWLGFPASAQRYLGMLWMAKLLYPEQAEYDLYEEVAKYFELFYHSEISREQFERLTANAFVK